MERYLSKFIIKDLQKKWFLLAALGRLAKQR